MINMTDAAITKVKSYLEEDENKGKALRLFVESGGCSGFQYGFTFDIVSGGNSANYQWFVSSPDVGLVNHSSAPPFHAILPPRFRYSPNHTRIIPNRDFVKTECRPVGLGQFLTRY